MTIHVLPTDIDRGRRAFFWLMLVALIVLGAGIGLRDPWPSDEPRFTLAAKQMVESGDWLFPHRGSELYSDKPPMLMWWEAAARSSDRAGGRAWTRRLEGTEPLDGGSTCA